MVKGSLVVDMLVKSCWNISRTPWTSSELAAAELPMSMCIEGRGGGERGLMRTTCSSELDIVLNWQVKSCTQEQ